VKPGKPKAESEPEASCAARRWARQVGSPSFRFSFFFLKERKCGESGERRCSVFSLSLLKARYASERAAAAAERESASFPRVEVERERERKIERSRLKKRKKGSELIDCRQKKRTATHGGVLFEDLLARSRVEFGAPGQALNGRSV